MSAPPFAVEVSPEPFEAGALLSAFTAGRDEVGGVVSFTGLCRRDDGVHALELESYPGFTEAAIAAEVDAARTRFDLVDAMVRHRTGRIAPGEAVVFVAAAGRHRRAAFEATDYLMDYLKSRAPFWKKEHAAAGARWVEPRAADHHDAARWDAQNDAARPRAQGSRP